MDPCKLCQRQYRDTDGPARNSTRDKKDTLIDELRASLKRLMTQVNDTRDNGFNSNHLIQFQSSTLQFHFSYCNLVDVVPDKVVRKLPPAIPAYNIKALPLYPPIILRLFRQQRNIMSITILRGDRLVQDDTLVNHQQLITIAKLYFSG